MKSLHFKRIVLASASPRRRELLLQIGLSPEISVSHVSEETENGLTPWETVVELASRKARDVAKSQETGTLVIGSDTVVAIDGRILGKPKDHEDAYRSVKLLAGRTHQVYTGVCLVLKGETEDRCLTFFDETDVELYPMTEEELREYSRMEEPMDKAGAYAVQGYFARYIKALRGSHPNVMGLPVGLLYQKLKELDAAAF